MELNDFQYNWYLRFEEENEKSIVGLPFDPYFEAHKFDEESVLKFVERARWMRQLRTSWVSNFISQYNKIESRWKAFEKKYESESLVELFNFGLFIIVLATPLITGLMGNNLYHFSEAFDPKPLWGIYGVGIMHRIFMVIWNYILAGITVYLSIAPIWVCVILPLAFLHEKLGVEIVPNRRDFAMIIALLLCTTVMPQAEADTANNVHEIEAVQLLTNQPTAEQLCSVVTQQGYNWYYKYKLADEEVYLVDSHRNGKLDNPVQLSNRSVRFVKVKDIHSECMQNFK